MKTFIIKVNEKLDCEFEDGTEGTHDVKREWKMCIHDGNVHYVAQGGVGAKLGEASPSLIKAAK